MYVCRLPTTNNRVQEVSMMYTKIHVNYTNPPKGKIYITKIRIAVEQRCLKLCFRDAFVYQVT